MKRKNIQNLLFDLDGTLVDSSGTISVSLAYALEQTGVELAVDTSFDTFIGMPLLEIFRDGFGLTLEQADAAINHYRKYYAALNQTGSRVYTGVGDLLAELKGSGYRLFVATVKPTEIAEKVLNDFELRNYFDGVAGASMGHERRDKTGIITHLLKEFDLDPVRSMMIGDRDQDILGARENGMGAIAVTYGFGSVEELRSAGPDHMVEQFDEIAVLLDV